MGGKSSKQEERKEGKESKKKEDKEKSISTTPFPPVSYSKPVPASTTPPPPVPSPITVTELNSSPRNGRKRELVVPVQRTIYNPNMLASTVSTVSLNTQQPSVVSGLIRTGSAKYLPVNGKSKSKNKRQNRKDTLDSSSSPPRSSSSSPTANSTGRLRKRRRWYRGRRHQKKKEKKPSKPAIFKKKRSNSTSETGGSPKGEEYIKVKKSSESENEDVNKKEQPLEEPTKTEPNPIHEEPVQKEETNSTASESNAPIFSYKVGEEEGFVTVYVPGIVPVEIKEGDNEYLEITIHKD